MRKIDVDLNKAVKNREKRKTTKPTKRPKIKLKVGKPKITRPTLAKLKETFQQLFVLQDARLSIIEKALDTMILNQSETREIVNNAKRSMEDFKVKLTNQNVARNEVINSLERTPGSIYRIFKAVDTGESRTRVALLDLHRRDLIIIANCMRYMIESCKNRDDVSRERELLERLQERVINR